MSGPAQPRERAERKWKFNNAGSRYLVRLARVRTYDSYFMVARDEMRDPVFGDRTACVGNVADVHERESKTVAESTRWYRRGRSQSNCNLEFPQTLTRTLAGTP